MEEPKTTQTTPPIETLTSTPTPTPTPTPTANPDPDPNPDPNPPQTLPPQPPPVPPLQQESKKRPIDENGHIQSSNYFKMRAVVKDLRPHFIEVLQTPVIQNCNAAHEIQEQMKLLMDLYKEMTAETISIKKCTNLPESPFSGEIPDGQKPREHHQDIKPFVKDSDEKQAQGSYIVGGSAFGWNFITFLGSKAVYYGRTKEMFKSANVIPQESPI